MQQFNMEQKEEYKETELGFLPESWGVDNLENEYIGFKNGLWKGKKEPFVKAKVLRNTNFKNNGTIRLNNIAELDIEEKQFKTREIINGDIILERSGGGPAQPVGRVVFFDIEEGFNYSFSNFTSRIRVVNKENIFSKYLFYFLLYFYMSGKTNDIQSRTTGIRNLDFSKYKQIYIPLPPLPEQKKIANVLSIIQEAKEKTENVINSLKELKRSMMKHLFTYGPVSLEEAEKVKLKDTEIGMVPEEWDVKLLSKVTDIIMGQSPPGDTYNKSEGMPFLQGKAEFGFMHPKHIKFTTKPIKVANKNSIVMSVRAPVGDVNIANKKYCIGRGLCSLSLKEGDNMFLYYLLIFYKSKIENEGTGSTFKAINKSKIENFKIQYPLKSIRQQIVSTLSKIDLKIEREKSKKDALEELFKSMLHNLMTAKIRVNNLEI